MHCHLVEQHCIPECERRSIDSSYTAVGSSIVIKDVCHCPFHKRIGAFRKDIECGKLSK